MDLFSRILIYDILLLFYLSIYYFWYVGSRSFLIIRRIFEILYFFKVRLKV